jgi:exopolysaccharide biosynthesis protein
MPVLFDPCIRDLLNPANAEGSLMKLPAHDSERLGSTPRHLRHSLVMAAVLLGAAGAAGATQTVTQPYLGITRITDTISLSAPLDQTAGTGLGSHVAKINLLKIDLSARGIGFKLSPDNGAAAGETLTQTTLSFMTQEGAQLAVNAHFFNFTTNAAVNSTVTGFAASNGTVFSAFEAAPLANTLLPYALTADSPGLNISASNEARIVNVGATQTSLAGGVVPYNTVSGSDQVIINGAKSLPAVVAAVTGPHQILAKTVPPFSGAALGNWYTDQIAARTAMGLSADNKTLFIFTVDAAGGSNGMTVSEEVDYLLAGGFGIDSLLNLDGGGSTTLAMEDPVTHVGSVVNGIGAPHFVGTSLAVFASPVPEPTVAMLCALGLACIGWRLRQR